MREPKRKRDYEYSGPARDVFIRMVDHVLSGANSIHVVVGPICWQPSDGAKSWYFIVATSEKEHGFRCDQITLTNSTTRDKDRARFIAAFGCRSQPVVVHVTDDELEMAKVCESLWPGPRIERIRVGIEAERKAKAKP